MNRLRVGWAVLIVAGLVGAIVLVWRSDVLLSALDPGPLGTAEDVQVWTAEVARVHGTRADWLAPGEIELHTRGRLVFAPLRVMFGTAWADPVVDLTLVFRPDTHGPYRYTLRQGESVTSGRVDTRADRDGRGFLLDSVRHLFELPWSVPAVPYRRGLAPRDGLAGVFATWGDDPRPTRAHDQIAVWARNGHVVRLDTTGRDVAPFIVARVDYTGELPFEGLRLPQRAVVRDTKGKIVHEWELLAVRRPGLPPEDAPATMPR